MAAKSQGLQQLHAFHQQLKNVTSQLQQGPRLIKAKQQLTQVKQTEIDAEKERIKKLRMQADQGSLQIKTNESKIVNLQVKLNQSNETREYNALLAQIDADTMANSVLEDEVLAMLERLDLAKQNLAKLEEELVTLKQDETRFIKEINDKEPGLRKQASELEAKVAEAEVIIPSDVKTLYRRLVQAHGPEAFATLDGNQCQGCFVTLSVQMMVEINAGAFKFCRSCGKIVYPT